MHQKRESLEASLVFFFSLMVVASEEAARLRWKMAVPIVSLGIRYLEPLLNGGGGAMGRGL